MDVATVGFKDWGAAKKTTANGKTDIYEWKSKSHEWCCHAEHGAGALTPNETEAAQHEADGKAATVAEKDGGRAEVVAQKCEQAACKRHGRHREAEVAADESGEKGHECSKEPDTGR
jgi:hypothetical protein